MSSASLAQNLLSFRPKEVINCGTSRGKDGLDEGEDLISIILNIKLFNLSFFNLIFVLNLSRK